MKVLRCRYYNTNLNVRADSVRVGIPVPGCSVSAIDGRLSALLQGHNVVLLVTIVLTKVLYVDLT